MMTDNETHRLMEREFPDCSRGQREVLAELYQELKAQGASERWEREAAAEETERPVCTLAKKKSRKPAACVSSRSSDSLEEDMSRDTDSFWQASEVAWKQLGELQKDNFAEAMEWLRQVQPARYKELTHHWLEYISSLWASRELTAFEKALDSWVGLHVQVVKTYQLVRTLQKP